MIQEEGEWLESRRKQEEEGAAGKDVVCTEAAVMKLE